MSQGCVSGMFWFLCTIYRGRVLGVIQRRLRVTFAHSRRGRVSKKESVLFTIGQPISHGPFDRAQRVGSGLLPGVGAAPFAAKPFTGPT